MRQNKARWEESEEKILKDLNILNLTIWRKGFICFSPNMLTLFTYKIHTLKVQGTLQNHRY